MAYNDGEICDWFENGTCSCFLNGSRCDCPFSNRGCQIQCEKIFKEKPEGEKANRYKTETHINENKILTKRGVFKELRIKKGDAIADWFIPYSKLEMLTDPSEKITFGVDQVHRKFDESEFYLEDLLIYHNVEIFGQVGVYIIGTN